MNQASDGGKTITANPAAGPLTPSGESLAMPTTMPPIIPAIMPANKGVSEANAISRPAGLLQKKRQYLQAGRF